MLSAPPGTATRILLHAYDTPESDSTDIAVQDVATGSIYDCRNRSAKSATSPLHNAFTSPKNRQQSSGISTTPIDLINRCIAIQATANNPARRASPCHSSTKLSPVGLNPTVPLKETTIRLGLAQAKYQITLGSAAAESNSHLVSYWSIWQHAAPVRLHRRWNSGYQSCSYEIWRNI